MARCSLSGPPSDDRAGPRLVFGVGAALYVLAYAGFAAGVHAWWWRPQCQAPKPAQLREILVELYVFRRLTRTQVAEKLEVPESRVHTWLREFDLPVRTRGGMSREDRVWLAKGPLVALYVQAQMPAERVGARLGSTRRVVLASSHEHGVPVRPGGTGDNSRAIALLAALYADPQVLAVLRRRKVPLVRCTGPATDRFPRLSR